MPNDFAYLTLLVWPIVSIVLYTKYPVITATFWTIVGGYLLLPVGVKFDFPFFPGLDKRSIPAIMAYFGCRFIARQNIKILPPRGIERNLIILFFIGTLATVFTNGDPVIEANRYIPGLGFRDILSTVISQWLLLMPFILGLQLIKTHEDQVLFFKLLVIAGLCYSLPILFEIRMSPQLHRWTYGFFPHSWIQQIRYSGFRPVVFLGHGLWVAFFLVLVLGAALTLSKLKIRISYFPNKLVITYIIILLFLSKGFGSMILSMVLFVGITMFTSLFTMRIAMVIVTAAFSYPLLSILELFPHTYLVELIGSVSQSQAGSLGYRFNQEVMLLDRAQEKWLFGWGGWDRNRLADSVTDGYWIILFGKYGAIGFSAVFGLIVSTVLIGQRWFSRLQEKNDKTIIACHCLLAALIILDQIPNASMSPCAWLVIGGLAGRIAHIPKTNDRIKIHNTPI
ncbi:hypothetical protein NYF23_03280 [SAR92 clade bacterium H455]|uniref:O-antigen ligase domain-containing protein n=1 Tax=SAR92 clade bacterium H455 TaxID=2974818 RepID=A0ABY5TSK7_9GAMM|nr:hypothetical protein NYF23_03280 [SAR92 clade bacterium H455]